MSDESASSGFFDEFFILVSTAAIALTLIDWCLGEQRRHNMREKVGVWWVWLQDITWSGLAERDARAVLRVLRRMFGPRWLSARCALLVSVLSIVGTILLMLSYLFMHPALFHYSIDHRYAPSYVALRKCLPVICTRASLDTDLYGP